MEAQTQVVDSEKLPAGWKPGDKLPTVEIQPAEAQAAKPAENGKAIVSEPTEAKPVETKPAENGKDTKPTEAKPAETKEQKVGKKRTGVVPLEGTDYGDGMILGKTEKFRNVKEKKASNQLYEGNKDKVDMRKFFVALEKAGEISVAALKKMVGEHTGETDKLKLIRRLNWMSLGRYNRHNWHLTVKPNGKKATGSDKVLFHQVEK